MLIKIRHLATQYSLTLRYNHLNITLGDDFEISTAHWRLRVALCKSALVAMPRAIWQASFEFPSKV